MGVKVIGGPNNFWLYSPEGWDFTHPTTPTSDPIQPCINLNTTKGLVAIDPAKTALVIIDLQNYFLSPLLGRPRDSPGIKVVDQLLTHVIPSCRKVGIPVVWLGWGLTDEDIDAMPPAVIKGFAADTNFEGKNRTTGGLGSDIGPLKGEDGVVEGGKIMMRDQWNTDFYGPLVQAEEPGDMFVYKNRLSGFWGGTEVEKLLHERGIRTLLFSGCNLDQCVAGSLQDVFTKGWDCLLLSDGTATNSPEYARRCIEFNTGA
ncbi:Isochorismatase hydrolase [Podospora aff. communis PSN243]|uniref:Isochorismatase hydrolase n=1 Tax=Podospora aff. communis PSN243 TaxID=3040156 RepID=A0AAV9GGY0_9PEZI|nr:Isochorismatase hydrolase [Podospora aff. communis PSN243]